MGKIPKGEGFGGLAIGIVIAMVTVMIGVLLGGILSAQINQQFTNFNLSGTVWNQLFTQVQNIGTGALSIAIIGLLIVAFMAILYIFRGR